MYDSSVNFLTMEIRMPVFAVSRCQGTLTFHLVRFTLERFSAN